MAQNILLINGPNLNLLGMREPITVYGLITLDHVQNAATEQATAAGASLTSFQSNYEGALIDRIHEAKRDGTDVIVINPGGLTHTSVALRDALEAVSIPFIEVHISNIYQREKFRHFSYLSEIAAGVICGFGTDGYHAAIELALKKF